MWGGDGVSQAALYTYIHILVTMWDTPSNNPSPLRTGAVEGGDGRGEVALREQVLSEVEQRLGVVLYGSSVVWGVGCWCWCLWWSEGGVVMSVD